MRKGKIFLVGFGPGAEAHMSVRALQAIEEADVVVGYSTYIRLVKHLLDGKEVIRKGMTEEIDRCILAYEKAREGKTVALVSSGDIGVYGMAGPTYEVLLQSGWTPDSDIEVEVVPGSTALSACAALVGAPLTHDFCSISLSDLLTPWPVIAKRLEAAARSDFVVALYNPKSGRRTGQIVEAQRILLRHRKPDTPVAIVKSAYRDLQDIQMVRLDEMKDCKIGMLTTVLIGNSSTYLREGLMITPRGYHNKYEGLTGATREGEKRGRSLSMGLEGWKTCVREYLDTHPGAPLQQAARYFDCRIGEVLAAIAGNGGAGGLAARMLPKATLLAAARDWRKLRLGVENGSGAQAEVMLQGGDLELSGDSLKLGNAHVRLRIDWPHVQSACLLRSEDRAGAYFLDAHGDTVFSLYLQDADDLPRFDQTWQALAGQDAMAATA